MADRIYLEAGKPLSVEIRLQPKWMDYTHKRLYSNSNVYRMMVAYIFKDVQNRPSRKLQETIEFIPIILNRNSYRDIEITSAEIDLADDNLPRWDDEDFSEYINKFLDIIEKQNINLLSKHLTTDEVLNDSFFVDSTIKRMNKGGFSVRDLMNGGKMARTKNYIQEVGGQSTYVGEEEHTMPDRDLMSRIDDGLPLIWPLLEDHVTEADNIITVDTTSYMDKIAIRSHMGSIKRKDTFQYRTVKESEKLNYKLGSKSNSRLVYLRVNDNDLEINGFLGDKTFEGEHQIAEAYAHFISLDFSTASLDLLEKNKGNKIKNYIMSALTAGAGLAIADRQLGMHQSGEGLRSGNLLVGKLKIEYEKQPNFQELKSFTKKIEDIRNPNLPQEKQDKKEFKQRKNEEADHAQLQQAMKLLEKDPNHTQARVLISRLEDEYDKEWINYAASVTTEQLIEDQDDTITEEKTKEISSDIPLIYLKEVYLEKEYELDFKVARFSLGKKRKGEISMETIDPKTGKYGGEEKDLREKQVNDVNDLNRLKAAYMGLSRMVENYG